MRNATCTEAESYPMNAGDGSYSYHKNSYLQARGSFFSLNTIHMMLLMLFLFDSVVGFDVDDAIENICAENSRKLCQGND